MQAPGQTSVWRTPIRIGRASDAKGWYQQMKAWWTARNAARRDATLASVSTRRDSSREVVTPCRADAAANMAAERACGAAAIMLYGLSQ